MVVFRNYSWKAEKRCWRRAAKTIGGPLPWWSSANTYGFLHGGCERDKFYFEGLNMFRKVCFMALSLISGSSVSRSEGHI